MTIAIAQFSSVPGDIMRNLDVHLKWIEQAATQQADLILFPELSLTGYEPKLAQALAVDIDDPRLDVLQQTSGRLNMVICAGVPLKLAGGISICMLIYQPQQPVIGYSKQLLHSDELPYFIPGTSQPIFPVKGVTVAPAICYESLQPAHAEQASRLGATVYLASVAKSVHGIEKAYDYFPHLANKHNFNVVMVNSVGPADDFIGIGKSAAWNSAGECICALGEDTQELKVVHFRC